MEKKEKPRLAEVLGVEVGEEFIIREGPVDYKCVINQNGEADLSYWKIGYAINHPESIIRAPRLTKAERAICKAVGAKWVSRDDITDGSRISLYREKPVKIGNSFFAENAGAMIVSVWDESLFPSVHPGDCICVEEAGGDGD